MTPRQRARGVPIVAAAIVAAALTSSPTTGEVEPVALAAGDPEPSVALHPDLRGESAEETLEAIVEAVEGRARRTPSPQERVSVLVELLPGAERDELLRLAGDLGGACRYQYRILPDFVNLRGIPREQLARIAALPAVSRIHEDRRVRIHMNDSTPHVRGLRSQLQAAGLPETGSGVRICIVDTGIDPDHTMFAARIDAAAGYDFVNDDADPTDDNGHGSHVAGTALGRTGFDVDFGGGSGLESLQGVAPGATLIGVKVIEAGGGGSFSDVIAGIDHCADPALPNGPADVINMSLGGGLFSSACDDEPVAVASNNAVDAGVVVVASAGNAAQANALGAPACASKVIAVGATYDDDFPNPDFPDKETFSFVPICSDVMPRADDRTCFSNRTPQLDVAGPGCLTFSADGLDGSTTAITDKCGTSMSAPHVAGLAALLLDRDPTLTPADVRRLVRDGAVDLGPPGFDTGYGHGRIDAISSLRLASSCGIDADCDDGRFCNGVERCFAGACRLGTTACPGQACDEAADACVACATDADCDDGVVCNGDEVCDAGTCSPGPLACVDICDAENNRCVECLTDGDCTDGDSCTGVEVCSAAGVCEVEIVDCNDNAVDDLCDISGGTSLDQSPQNGVPDECDALVRFTLNVIPSLGGERAQGYGLNESGVVVGASETGQFDTAGQPITHAFVWDGATVTDLGTLGGENSFAYDVNEVGRIVGTADLSEPLPPPPVAGFFKNQPTQWDALVPTQLELLPGGGYWNGNARAVNDAGHVGGDSINGFEIIRGTLWNQGERPIEVPPMPNADMTDVWDVAPSGEAVGWWNETYLGFNRRAFRLPFGSQNAIDLGTLGGTWAWALGVDGKGRIVGQAGDAAGLLRPFLWQNGTMTDLGSLGGSFALARAINDQGKTRVVGASTYPGSTSLADTRAFVWENDALEELSDLVPGQLGWTVVDAWDVNDAGQIAGHGAHAQGGERALRLDPCGGTGPPCFVPSCAIDADCDDGVFCNGQETCPAGFCVRGLAPTCADADGCTQDYCDTALDACRNAPPGTPAEPVGVTLRLLGGGSSVAELEWPAVGGATSYNVYRGTQSSLGDLTCFLEGVTGTSAQDDGLVPAAGDALFHLVTAVNCGGESGLGDDRPAPPGCP